MSSISPSTHPVTHVVCRGSGTVVASRFRVLFLVDVEGWEYILQGSHCLLLEKHRFLWTLHGSIAWASKSKSGASDVRTSLMGWMNRRQSSLLSQKRNECPAKTAQLFRGSMHDSNLQPSTLRRKLHIFPFLGSWAGSTHTLVDPYFLWRNLVV